jgi:uncharacterized protein
MASTNGGAMRTVLAAILTLCLTLPAAAGWIEAVSAIRAGDYTTAREELLPLAEEGNLDAQYLLGVMYKNGDGGEENFVEAVRWLYAAAEQGNAGARYNLGIMYSRGMGVIQDDVEAVRWWRSAAGQGDSRAQNNLGLMYQNGRGVPQDFVHAHMWFNVAASRGNQTARINRDTVTAQMTLPQIAEAQELARKWMPAGEGEGE